MNNNLESRVKKCLYNKNADQILIKKNMKLSEIKLFILSYIRNY